MPKISDVYGKKPWLSGGDVKDGEERRLVVERRAFEQLGPNLKDVIWFAGEDQYLILDTFSGPALAAILGDETDNWPGKAVVVFTEPYRKKDGSEGRALRFKAAPDTPPPHKLTTGEKAQRRADEMDDEIPF